MRHLIMKSMHSSSADAKGNGTPDNATTTQLAALICSDPRTAAKQYMQMIEAGGSDAQARPLQGLAPIRSACS